MHATSVVCTVRKATHNYLKPGSCYATRGGVTYKATKFYKWNFSQQLPPGAFASKTKANSALAEALLNPHLLHPILRLAEE